ncbi:MAG: transcriptional activator RfaH [Pararhodobacter sp.]|nr:transcriptional activator RfaH [Pararhodobacter sp.]
MNAFRDHAAFGVTGSCPRADAHDADPYQWYAAQLKPNGEKIALRNLARQGFATFLPRLRKTERNKRQFKASTRPLFPGYVFVSFDPTEGHWRAINSTQGVSRIVSFGVRPTALPGAFVEALRGRCDADGLLQSVDALAPGDRAMVLDGPFADFVVQVEKVSDDHRLWVLFDLMGRQTRVALPRESLRRA